MGAKRGRPPVYDSRVEEVLLKVWQAAEQPCGKPLVRLLPLWLPHYEEEFGRLDKATRKLVLRVSAAQVDRILARRKAVGRRGRCGTKPGGLLKHHIPIRTSNWDITRPGFLEADTVAHCGESLEGDFVWSVTYTDIHSGWTALRAVWNKGAHGIVAATREWRPRYLSRSSALIATTARSSSTGIWSNTSKSGPNRSNSPARGPKRVV